MTDIPTDAPPEPGVPVQILLPPVNYALGERPGPDGKTQLVVQFTTIYGVQQYAFDPNSAIDFASKVRAKAKELNSGLTVVRTQPQGGAVDLSYAKDEDG